MTKYTLLTSICMSVSLDLSMHFDEVGNSTLELILWVVAHIGAFVFLIMADYKEDKLKNRIAALEKKLSDKED